MATIAVFIVGGLLLIVCAFYETDLTKKILKGTSKNVRWGYMLLTIGVFFFMAGLGGFYCQSFSSGALKTMRQRLNEPVIFESQLYGYIIVGKHMEEYGSSDDISFFIDIKDQLSSGETLKHVKTSPGLYKRVEIGNWFDYTLMNKLKVSELQISEPNSQKPEARE